MECDDDWPVNNHAPDPNHGAHRGGTNCVRDRFYCTPATRQSQYARPAAATTHRSKHTPRQNARASSKGGTRHDRRSPSICADQSTDGTADRSRIGTATLGACGYVAIPDNATRFDTASDDAHPYATNTAGDRICAKGNQWTDGRTIHSISRNRCYCHGDCDGGWSTDTPHNARDAAPPQTPFVPQTANPPSAGAPPLALNTAGLGPGAGPVVGTETGANVGTIPQPAGTTVVNPPPPLPQTTGPNATPITQGQTAQPTPPMQVSTSPTSPTMPNASAGALPTPSASSGQPAPTTAATVQTQIAPPINNTVSQSVSQTQNIPQTVINPAVPPLAAAGAVPSAPIMPIPQQTPQDVTWLLAVNAALVPGWPNVTGQLQNIVKQQQSVKDALETAAHQLRSMSPDQRAMALAQLGLPRHAFAIIERLARRLAKSLENDIPPDLVVGFLIALLTTLGHVSDALRYVDSILRNADAG